MGINVDYIWQNGIQYRRYSDYGGGIMLIPIGKNEKGTYDSLIGQVKHLYQSSDSSCVQTKKKLDGSSLGSDILKSLEDAGIYINEIRMKANYNGGVAIFLDGYAGVK